MILGLNIKVIPSVNKSVIIKLIYIYINVVDTSDYTPSTQMKKLAMKIKGQRGLPKV
jgi:hypothetical protein